MDIGGTIMTMETRSARRKLWSSATLSITNHLTWNNLGL